MLAGDASGNRILKAAELVRARLRSEGAGERPGRVLRISRVRSGDSVCDESTGIRNRTSFTSNTLLFRPRKKRWPPLPELRRLGAKTYLLVTSDYHTPPGRPGFFAPAAPDLTFIRGRRAGSVFQRPGAGGTIAKAARFS